MNRQAVQTLKTYFGYDTFREGQESVVESILEHRDVLAIMPTGAGKSIYGSRMIFWKKGKHMPGHHPLLLCFFSFYLLSSDSHILSNTCLL